MGKAATQSTTIIASIIAILAGLAPLVGWTISETDQAALRTVLESGLLVISNIVVIVSAIAAIWGRWTAKDQITGVVRPSPPSTTARDLNLEELNRLGRN